MCYLPPQYSVLSACLAACLSACRSVCSSVRVREIQCCHANQDAGFLVTYSHVRDTLADRCYRTVFECLSGDPSKTFNVAEASSFRSLPLCRSAALSVALSVSRSHSLAHCCLWQVNFFSHWYDRQNATVQSRVKAMTQSGQYWFAEGGWVQPDEGCTTVLGRVNQATLGQVSALSLSLPPSLSVRARVRACVCGEVRLRVWLLCDCVCDCMCVRVTACVTACV